MDAKPITLPRHTLVQMSAPLVVGAVGRGTRIVMEQSKLRGILEEVRLGRTSVDAAFNALRDAPVADLGFAQVDLQRSRRCGYPEVIYGEGKTADQLSAIFARIVAEGEGCLATRVDEPKAARLRLDFPKAVYDSVARTFWQAPDETPPLIGSVAVVAAGTSDLSVAREAHNTAAAMHCRVEMLVDVGVAGLHRILSARSLLARQDAVVVVAGMEGALPSVVGGLVSCPVIAVPSSVGYGASFQGLAALLGMLSSCAANVAVVNIDAGFCGGYVAALIARRASARPSESC